MKSPLDVLRDLVRIESPSGNEERAVEYLAAFLREAGHRPIVHGRNVWALRSAPRPGHTLLLNSHIDTVPATPAWTRPPFEAVIEEDRLYGLGVSDAKACVVGMLFAFLEAELVSGAVLWTATCDEEIGGEQGLKALLPTLPDFQAAIVGEPTDMQPCVAQKGRVVLEIAATGRAGHASRPWEGVNAIYPLSRAALAVESLTAELSRSPLDPVLGPATAVATLVHGGTRSNVIPPSCTLTVDGRTTPAVPNADLIDRVRDVASRAGGDAISVTVKSGHCTPVRTQESEPLVRAALVGLPGAAPRAFGGVSDLFHVRARPGIVLGPGAPPQSHQADEHITLERLDRGFEGYRRVVETYLGGGP